MSSSSPRLVPKYCWNVADTGCEILLSSKASCRKCRLSYKNTFFRVEHFIFMWLTGRVSITMSFIKLLNYTQIWLLSVWPCFVEPTFVLSFHFLITLVKLSRLNRCSTFRLLRWLFCKFPYIFVSFVVIFVFNGISTFTFWLTPRVLYIK